MAKTRMVVVAFFGRYRTDALYAMPSSTITANNDTALVNVKNAGAS